MTTFEIFLQFAADIQIDIKATPQTIKKFNKSVILHKVKDEVAIVAQNAIANNLFFLKSGTATFVKNRDNSEIVIAKIAKKMVPLGISGLNSPGRYMAEIRINGPAVYFSIELNLFWDLVQADPRFGVRFLAFTLGQATKLLWSTREVELPIYDKGVEPSLGTTYSIDKNIMSRIADTGFFVTLSAKSLEQILNYSQVLLYSKNQKITREGQKSNGIQILLSGRLYVSFTNSRNKSTITQTRTIVRPGMVLSWHNGFSDLPSPYTVKVSRDTTVLYFSQEALLSLFNDDPQLGASLIQRQLWQIGRYQQTVTGLSSYGTEEEVVLIKNLLTDNQPQIPVSSLLHGVPHALKNRFTVDYALDCIYNSLIQGNTAERSVAGLMLDFLEGVERANRFFKKLTLIYDRVAGAPRNANSSTLRELSNADFSSLFSHVPYAIKGLDNLPKKPENIFFYNHLASIPENTLANGHSFSIDSHFVSSMILLKKYGDGGQRIVRASRETEFWRNGYYARLDNIFVHNRESDWLEETTQEKKWRKESFFSSAQKVFELGRPLAIAPEGTSETENNLTSTSPGELKPGAFLLADRLEPKPLLVPIALANFDKSVGRTTYAAVIKEPFRISQYVSDVDNKKEMRQFLETYRQKFKGYISEARKLAKDIQSGDCCTDLSTYTNVGFLSPIEQEFEIDVRELEAHLEFNTRSNEKIVLYGGSTFRLWNDAISDSGLTNLINLGFGGATIAACRVYLKRLVLPYSPKHLIIYAGDNDLGNGVSAKKATYEFTLFLAEIAEMLPDTKCYFISVKPSPFRTPFLNNIVLFNKYVHDLIEFKKNWEYIDLFTPMINELGLPSNSFYSSDPLHLNNTGYALLGKLIRDKINQI